MMTQAPAAPPPWLKLVSRLSGVALALVAAVWLVLALAWGLLHGWIVPRLDQWRERVELIASEQLGVPVRIGALRAQSGGVFPAFELVDVRLLDAQQQAALHLPSVRVSLSARSILTLSAEQIQLEAPELEVRRLSDGRILVAGLDVSRAQGGGDASAADWFFDQGQVILNSGKLRWRDDLRGTAPLELRDISFVADNGVRSHKLLLEATPPPDWGQRFSLRALLREPLWPLAGKPWRDWDTEVYAQFTHVDVARLREYADLGVQLRSGRGAMRVWAEVANQQLRGVVADVAIESVDVTLRQDLPALSLSAVSGRVGGKQLARGFEFFTQNLQFLTAQGQRWPGGNVALSWTQAEGKMLAQGELKADKLDLGALSQLAERLPLGQVVHQNLQRYAPRGLVQQLQARWSGPLDNPLRYELRGQVSGIALAAQAVARKPSDTHEAVGIPGLRGADVEFQLNQAGGKAKLDIRKGALEFPGVFAAPVLLMDELQAQVLWQVGDSGLAVQVNELKFVNADVQGQARARWQSGSKLGGVAHRFPGVLDLTGSLSRADGAQVYRYLPLGVAKVARDYVRDAVSQGRVSAVNFKLKGDLAQFPFADSRQGEFRISAKIQDVAYNYVPPSFAAAKDLPWPGLERLSADLEFDRLSMKVLNASARVVGAAGWGVSKAQAQIADLAHPQVQAQAQLNGPLDQALSLVKTSPLNQMTAQALAQAEGAGAIELKLQLDLPLAQMERAKINGNVSINNNELRLSADTPGFSRMRGTVSFSADSFTLNNVQARTLGGDTRLEGGLSAARSAGGALRSDAAPALVIRASGNATAEGLRAAPELGLVSQLARHMQGGANYNLSWQLRHGQPELFISSNLVGLSSNLPVPLNKRADTPLPLRYENTAVIGSGAGPGASPGVSLGAAGGPVAKATQDQIVLDVGTQLAMAYQRSLAGDTPRVLRGALHLGPVGSAPALPNAGVSARVVLPALDMDQWLKALETLSGASAASAAASPVQWAYAPSQGRLNVGVLSAGGRRAHDVEASFTREALSWRANVQARELAGQLEYQTPSAGASTGRVQARLSRLKLDEDGAIPTSNPTGATSGATSAASATLEESLTTLPALDLVVDNFELRGKALGKLEIEANALALTREWRLAKLNLSSPEGQFSAQGSWAPASPNNLTATSATPRRRMALDFRWDVADAGKQLTRLGFAGIVRGGKGSLNGRVNWLGSPLALDYASLTGQMQINIETGQFLKADAGAAKLLGILSLQSLPRRLLLDFRDVFSEGFAFDFVRGDARLERGVLSTNNLQMKGVNAAVLMEGKTDLANETQDLRVVVVPEINAGTASLVAGVINPAIGVGTFLAQMILRAPLIRANTREFHVDGTWSEPRVARVPYVPPPAEGASAPVKRASGDGPL